MIEIQSSSLSGSSCDKILYFSNTRFPWSPSFVYFSSPSSLSQSLNNRNTNELVRHPAVRSDDSEVDEIFDFFQTDAQ